MLELLHVGVRSPIVFEEIRVGAFRKWEMVRIEGWYIMNTDQQVLFLVLKIARAIHCLSLLPCH